MKGGRQKKPMKGRSSEIALLVSLPFAPRAASAAAKEKARRKWVKQNGKERQQESNEVERNPMKESVQWKRIVNITALPERECGCEHGKEVRRKSVRTHGKEKQIEPKEVNWEPTKATFGSVPCACVLVSSLYYKPSMKERSFEIALLLSLPSAPRAASAAAETWNRE